MYDQDQQIDDAEHDAVRQQQDAENEAEVYDEVTLAAERVRAFLDARTRHRGLDSQDITGVSDPTIGGDIRHLTTHDLRVLLAAVEATR